MPRVGCAQRSSASTRYGAGLEVDDGLVVQAKFAPVESPSEIRLELQRLHDALVQLTVEHLVAPASVELRPVHGRVGVAHDVFRPPVAGGAERDADAGHGVHLLLAEGERQAQLRQDPVRHAGRVANVPDVAEQHAELVAAEPRHGVAVAHARLEPSGQGHEQLIAAAVSQAFVDHAEPVQVQAGHSEAVLRMPLALPQQPLQPIHEQRAVRQAGERVVERVVDQLLLGPLALADVVHHAHHTHDIAQA
jgi:hypothetical protein